MTNNDKLPVPISEDKTVPLPENKAAGPINPRAMGLYNLHDPKDRPHSRPHAGAIPSWARKDPANNGDRNGSFGSVPRPDNSFPEWFDDTESDKILESTGGSFDSNGRFRKEVNGRPSQWKLPQSHKERTEVQDRRATSSPRELNNTPSEKSLERVEFYYLDPSNMLQGPFSKNQMYTWYEMHYFNDNLKVRRSTDLEFKTLDELKKLNGEKLFDFKPSELPKKFRYPPNIPPTGLPDLINPKLGGLFGGTTWNDTLTQSRTLPLNRTTAAIDFEQNSQQLERERYDLKKKQEELAAQQRKLEEQTKQLNIVTQKKEEFLQKQFHDELLKKEMQNLELQRKMETMAAMNQVLLEAERIRAEERLKAAEEHRKKMEERKIAEDKRIAEENKRRQEEERFSYNSRRAEEAAEEHRKMLRKKAEEDSAIIRKKQQAEAANRQEVRQVYKDTEGMVTNENKPAVKEDQWQTVAKKAPQQKSKASAWSNGEQSPGQTGKTLREIQDEESQQEAKIRKEEEKQRANSLPIGSWPNANRTQQWVAGTVTKTPTKPAWGGAASNPRPAAKSALNWDGPTLQAANRSPPVIAANKKSPPKIAQKIQAKSLVEESFKQWFEKRLQDLAGSQIDATVLIEFLDGVGSPNEVEDYIQEYAGDSKAVKDFTKEYLQRRSESRQRNKADKDDLSSASKAGSPTAANIGKKKKNKSCLQALIQNSPNAQVFCLVHKMDLIEESKRNTSFAEKEKEILRYSALAYGYNSQVIKIFRSSIWDETLYKAWSAIVYRLIPNVTQMEEKLKHFAEAIEADEVLLFERATFLVIAHAEMTEHKDVHRFEKVSNIIKQFKLSCSKTQSQFDFMHVKNKNYAAFIDTFTANTFIMVILPDANISPATTLMNIKSARKAFEKLEAR